MAELREEIAAYEKMQADLESKSMGQWVLVHDLKLVGVFPTLEAAAEMAVKQFGRGPYLIRQIGASAMTLPASVMYRPVYANSQLRVR